MGVSSMFMIKARVDGRETVVRGFRACKSVLTLTWLKMPWGFEKPVFTWPSSKHMKSISTKYCYTIRFEQWCSTHLNPFTTSVNWFNLCFFWSSRLYKCHCINNVFVCNDGFLPIRCICEPFEHLIKHYLVV